MIPKLDCRGLACPAPVLQTKDLIEKTGADALIVTVDNDASRQNVMRFLQSQGFAVAEEREGSNYILSGRRKDTPPPAPDKPEPAGRKILVMLTNDCLGHDDEELGRKLMASFLKTLKEMGEELWRLVLVNNGVKLTLGGSEVLEDLKALEASGTYIMVCGTCLMHFGLLEQKQVGETTNMLDIVTSLQLADSVINL